MINFNFIKIKNVCSMEDPVKRMDDPVKLHMSRKH